MTAQKNALSGLEMSGKQNAQSHQKSDGQDNMDTEKAKLLAALDLNRKELDQVTLKNAESNVQVVVSTPWWTTESAMTISASVLIFGVLILAMASYLILRGGKAESVLRVFGTIIILIAAVFLVVAGYSSNQIAPVMGLLGTIAGYLLGKEVNHLNASKKDE